MIINDLKKQLKQAMKNNSEEKNYIRSVLAKIVEYSVENKLDRMKPISDDDAIKVISSLKKSLEKALEMFKKGGEENSKLAENYRNEISFYNRFLPSDDDKKEQIENLVSNALAELNVTDVKQMGRVVGYIMKNNTGLDGSLVKKLVLEKLSK